MTYQNFKKSMIHFLYQNLDQCNITVQPITKNNHIVLDGLTILETGSNISPTIYLNYYYDELKAGHKSLEDIQTHILKTYLANRPNEKIDVSFFTEYENIRSRIAYKLIHQKQNEELLKEIPHICFLDLAIVFYCLVTTTPSGSATILVHNHHLDIWNITVDTLHQQAMENTPALLPAEFLKMSHLLDLPEVQHAPMQILTNTKRLNGACCILYPKLLENFAETQEADFYIIPSSIHEVLLLPVESDYTSAELNEMVREVNTTQVSAEEILSDHVYLYSHKKNTIEIPTLFSH